MAEDLTKKYTNGEVTIVWKPHMCTHSKLCWTHLRQVFDPFVKPWINPQGALTQEIIEQIKTCPSAALTYYMNSDAPETLNVDNIPEA